MHVAFLNPQGNFDPDDSYWAGHPDFGGQLVYVKEVALALADLGVRVDIVTRRIRDPEWPEFSGDVDYYEGSPDNPRILRIPCGGDSFLRKEALWPCLVEFVDNLLESYGSDAPDFVTSHYADGGYCAALIQSRTGLGFSFTGHSLGAQKFDKLGVDADNAADMEDTFRFSRRIHAERLSMERATTMITSTAQERFEQYSHSLYSGAVEVADDERFAVIPPGVNTGVFTTRDQAWDEEVIERVFSPATISRRRYIIVSSRLDGKKNVGGVVAAYASNETLRDRARLAIVIRGVPDPYGDISMLPESEREVLRQILEIVRSGRLEESIDFLDVRSQQDLASVYRGLARRGSVFALTSFYEPFGLAPIEAAACGLGGVATRNGGPSEIFVDGAGALVDPTDAQDIGRGLLEALEDYERYAERGRVRVSEKYTWHATASGYLEVITRNRGRGNGLGVPVPELDCAERIARYLHTR